MRLSSFIELHLYFIQYHYMLRSIAADSSTADERNPTQALQIGYALALKERDALLRDKALALEEKDEVFRQLQLVKSERDSALANLENITGKPSKNTNS